MAPARSFIRGAVVLLSAAATAIIVSGCHTLRAIDDLPPGTPKGWVVFVGDEGLPLSIARVAEGLEGKPYGARTPRGTPVAAACPPGRNDFVVRDPGGATRVTVPVAEGLVTYVGVAMQVTAAGPPIAYRTRVSVGTHPLPLAPRREDPAPLVTALVDGDWATRWAAARALERVSPPLEPTAAPLLTDMAREDAHELVRAAARRALGKAGKAPPAEPLAFISFMRGAEGWPLGEGLASFTSLLSEGYVLRVDDARGAAWRTRGLEDAAAGRDDLDVLMECRRQGGDATGAYGLTLGSGLATFLAFCVSPGGGAAVIRIVDGRERSTDLPWRFGAAAAITGTPVARIGVAKRGVRYELTVNGEAIGGFRDDDGMAVERVGVFVDGAQSVVFRKIVVAAP